MSAEAEELLQAGTRLFDSFLDRRVRPDLRSTAPSVVADPILYSLAAPGKRFRPLLLLLCAGLDPRSQPTAPEPGSHLEEALLAAAAVEAIHTYSLIHDDLPCMDDDDLRRGQPACHIAYGEWAAVLAGDGLNTYAFRLLAEIPRSTTELVRILAEASGVSGMVGGQGLDLQAERAGGQKSDAKLRAELLDEIHARKTAALISAACEMGAVIAGTEEGRARATFARLGARLGLLFQISDDILDEVGEAGVMGKRTGQDRAHGKLTYPALHGVPRAREKCAELERELQGICAELVFGSRAESPAGSQLAALCAFTANRRR